MNDYIYPHLLELKERIHGSADWANIDFSINTNPLGPPKSIIKLLQQKDLTWLTKYPEIHANQLKEKFSEKLSIQKEQLIIGNGAAELFFLLPRVLKIQRGIVIHPTFGEYEPSLLAANIPIERLYYHLHGDRFIFPMSKIKDTLKTGDIIYLCRPNNPTGQMVPLYKIKQLLDIVEERKAFLLVDESFIDFTNEPEGLLSYFRENKPLIIVRSLTKLYTIPGIRLGYLIAPSWLVHRLELARDPWSVNALSQKIGLFVLDERIFYQNTRKWIKEEREWFYQQMKELNYFSIFPSTANFYLLRSFKNDVPHLHHYLKTKGFAIRMAGSFLGLNESFFRLAVRIREENQLLIEELRSFVSKR